MQLSEWCAEAQQDQNVRGKSHLYANYRQSRSKELVTSRGIDSFKSSLDMVDGATVLAGSAAHAHLGQPGGFANFVLRELEQKYYQPARPAGLTSDFRIDGTLIPRATDVLIVNVRRHDIERFGGASGIGAAPFGPAAPAYTDIVWLTRPEHAIKKLRRLLPNRHARLTELAFFRELSAQLGLKRGRKSSTMFQVNLYKIESTRLLVRPHALSRGYPDRFCGSSRFKHFGATIDNRNGETGLPEAIVLFENTPPLKSSDPEYVELKRKLNKIADWIDPHSDSMIEATLDTDEVHADDLSYDLLRPMIMRRLKERIAPCDGHIVAGCLCV